MKRFSLRAAFLVLAAICAIFAIVRAVTSTVTPVTVTTDRSDVVAYLDDQMLGTPPAKISWSRFWSLFGFSANKFESESIYSASIGNFVVSHPRDDGTCPLFYLKPKDEANAERNGMFLADSPFGKVVQVQAGYWDEEQRCLHLMTVRQIRATDQRARITRATREDDGQIHVEIWLPPAIQKLSSDSSEPLKLRVSVVLRSYEPPSYISSGEIIDVCSLVARDKGYYYTTKINNRYDSNELWIEGNVYGEGRPGSLPGLSATIPVVRVEDLSGATPASESVGEDE